LVVQSTREFRKLDRRDQLTIRENANVTMKENESITIAANKNAAFFLHHGSVSK
jgi:hypothetical protein